MLPTIAPAPFPTGGRTASVSRFSRRAGSVTDSTARLAQLLALQARIAAEIAAELALIERLTGVTADDLAAPELVEVAARMGVRAEQLLAADRRTDATRRRHVAAWLLTDLGLSSTRVGALLHRDHTTVLHSLRVVESDPELYANATALARRRKSA